MRRTRVSRGISIPELLVSMSIMAIILSIVAVEFSAIGAHARKTNGDVDAERSARIAMAHVTKELRQAMVDIHASPSANAAPAPCSQPQYPVAQPGPSATPAPSPTAASTLTCSEAEQFTSSNPDPAVGNLVYDNFTISLGTPPPGESGGVLLLTVTTPNGSTSQRILGNNISGFAVLPVSKDVFDISISVPNPTNAAKQTYTLTSSVFLSYFQENT